MPSTPHKLDLYRLAVQHPHAETSLLARIYAHHRRGRWPTLLREDFAGTAAIASAFVAQHEDCRALAIDFHAPTCAWARRRADRVLGDRAGDLIALCEDVRSVVSPRVDVVAALNFSSFIFHRRDDLRAYFRVARRALRPGGVLVLDAYGGPGALRVGMQTRRVDPAALAVAGASGVADDDALDAHRPPFDYLWEQRRVDLLSARVDCRIHFRLRGGRMIRSAFHYEWRLWSLAELAEVMVEAGFAQARVWCEGAAGGRATRRAGPGVYAPVRSLPTREDFVAYVVGLK
ncbi:MAG: class I SAM-dependent methyltransferase [Planctomycetota bacterium]|nr:class I SAM-dependent methyltransferase [Planctomycetota bacterium]